MIEDKLNYIEKQEQAYRARVEKRRKRDADKQQNRLIPESPELDIGV